MEETKRWEVINPLILMYRLPDGEIVTRLHHDQDFDHRGYGILIADLVCHVAKAFGVKDDDVWDWVEDERRHPTRPIMEVS